MCDTSSTSPLTKKALCFLDGARGLKAEVSAREDELDMGQTSDLRAQLARMQAAPPPRPPAVKPAASAAVPADPSPASGRPLPPASSSSRTTVPGELCWHLFHWWRPEGLPACARENTPRLQPSQPSSRVTTTITPFMGVEARSHSWTWGSVHTWTWGLGRNPIQVLSTLNVFIRSLHWHLNREFFRSSYS